MRRVDRRPCRGRPGPSALDARQACRRRPGCARCAAARRRRGAGVEQRLSAAARVRQMSSGITIAGGDAVERHARQDAGAGTPARRASRSCRPTGSSAGSRARRASPRGRRSTRSSCTARRRRPALRAPARTARARGGIGVEYVVVARLEGLARQRRRTAGTALVDQHDVVRRSSVRRGERREARSGAGRRRDHRGSPGRARTSTRRQAVLRRRGVRRQHGRENPPIFRPSALGARSRGLPGRSPHCAAVSKRGSRQSASASVAGAARPRCRSRRRASAAARVTRARRGANAAR